MNPMPALQAAVAVQHAPILGLAMAGVALLAFRTGTDLAIRYVLQRRGSMIRTSLPREIFKGFLGLSAFAALTTATALMIVLHLLDHGTLR
jgi:hypothetical protein